MIGDELSPGASRRIRELDWQDALIAADPLHQWGSTFLVDEGPTGLIRVYLRDVTGAGRHVCLRLDAAASMQARAGVAEVEALSRRAADLVTADQERGASTLDQLRAQEAASAAFVARAEALYRELLTPR